MEQDSEQDGRDRAYVLCEHALSLIAQGDDWSDLGGGAGIGYWSNRRFRATLLEAAPATIENAYVPHVLEIWDGDRKVFSASWEHPHVLRSQVFVQGEWQSEFLKVR